MEVANALIFGGFTAITCTRPVVRAVDGRSAFQVFQGETRASMRAFTAAAVLSTCCCYSAAHNVSPGRHLREGNVDANDGRGGMDERSPARLAAANALRQLAAVEVDQGTGQSSATGGSLFAMEKSRT